MDRLENGICVYKMFCASNNGSTEFAMFGEGDYADRISFKAEEITPIGIPFTFLVDNESSALDSVKEVISCARAKKQNSAFCFPRDFPDSSQIGYLSGSRTKIELSFGGEKMPKLTSKIEACQLYRLNIE